MIGISVFYTADSHDPRSRIFIVLTIGIIKGYANSDGKQLREKTINSNYYFKLKNGMLKQN